MSKSREAPSPDPWPEAIRLATASLLEPPAEMPPAPDSPEAVLEWLPALVSALRVQCGAAARARANRQARRGWLRGQGGRAVAQAVEEIGKAKEGAKP